MSKPTVTRRSVAGMQVQFALDMESSDNVSVVLVCFNDALKPKKKPGHSGRGNSVSRLQTVFSH